MIVGAAPSERTLFPGGFPCQRHDEGISAVRRGDHDKGMNEPVSPARLIRAGHQKQSSQPQSIGWRTEGLIWPARRRSIWCEEKADPSSNYVGGIMRARLLSSAVEDVKESV